MRFAVTGEGPEQRAYVWVLLKQGLEWKQLSRADNPSERYAKAIASGLSGLRY